MNPIELEDAANRRMAEIEANMGRLKGACKRFHDSLNNELSPGVFRVIHEKVVSEFDMQLRFAFIVSVGNMHYVEGVGAKVSTGKKDSVTIEIGNAHRLTSKDGSIDEETKAFLLKHFLTEVNQSRLERWHNSAKLKERIEREDWDDLK